MDEQSNDLLNYDDMNEEEEEALLRDYQSSEGEMTAGKANDTEKKGKHDSKEYKDDTDDSIEYEEEQDLKRYSELLQFISQNKYFYDGYVELVNLSHKLCDLEKIRESCNLFSSVFPLAPEMWVKWLQIESNLATSPKELDNLSRLFETALNDYYSFEVALEYSKFAVRLPNPSRIRDEILATYGLHVTKGRKLFQFWRDYYAESISDNSERINILSELFKEELKLPLQNMEESYIEFKVLYEKNKDILTPITNWDYIEENYNKAKGILEILLSFENRLANLDLKFYQERAATYFEYIEEVKRVLTENQLQIIYERMITDCCLNPTCWMKYAKYIEKRDKLEKRKLENSFPVFTQTVLNILNRALRNCTWNEQLYIEKLYYSEKLNLPKTEIQPIIENALEVGFQKPEPLVTLWLEYLSYLRRNTNYENEKEVDILRKNFELCWSSLGRQWGVLADCNCEILQFWGRLEYCQLYNPLKGRELWNTVMESADNALKSALWMEFAHFELKNDLDETRRIFQRALNETTIDNPYVVASAWLRLERCNGSLENLIFCKEISEKALENYEFKQQMQISKRRNFKTEQYPKRKCLKRKFINTDVKVTKQNEFDDDDEFKQVSPSSSKNEEHMAPKTKKTKITSINIEEKSEQNEQVNVSKISKEHENEKIDTSKDHLRIFLSNLDYNITEENIKEGLKNLEIVDVNLIYTSNGRSRGFGYVELKSESEVQKALQMDRVKLNNRPLYISSVLRDKEKRQKFKFSDELEPTKLFVKGLPYDIKREELENVFKPCGKLKDIRIVYHKSGKPKGIAYVEYEDEAAACTAVLKLDNYDIRGHTVNVAISLPPPKQLANKSVNIGRMLGIGGSKKTSALGREQKPRMNLIPTVIRKSITLSESKPNTSQNDGFVDKKKSNEDFRKLLTK